MNRRVYYSVLLFILFVLPAHARMRSWGYCAPGGIKVVTVGLQSTTKVMGSYPGCTVTVYLTGTLTLATIFSDNNGTGKANPFTASVTDGYWFWYANNGRYDVKLSGGGIPTPFTLGDVQLLDGGRSGTVQLVHDNAGVWTVLQPDGSALNITGSTTSGLQEAIDYGHSFGYCVVVQGGEIIGGGTNGVQRITTKTPITFPVADSGCFDSNNVDYLYDVANGADPSKDFMTKESSDIRHFKIRGQILYPGNASGFRFLPTLDNGENFIGGVDEDVVIDGVACIDPITFAPDPNRCASAIRITPANHAIVNSRWTISAAGGKIGLAVDSPTAGGAFFLNQITSNAMINAGNIGVQIGSGVLAGGLIYGNQYWLQITTQGTGTAFEHWGGEGVSGGDEAWLSIQGGATCVHAGSSTIRNTFHATRYNCPVPILDDSSTRTNRFDFAGLTGVVKTDWVATTVTNTVTETVLDTCGTFGQPTLQPNALRIGSQIRQRMSGVYYTANGADTVLLRINDGATHWAGVTSPVGQVTGSPFFLEWLTIVKSIGAAGHIDTDIVTAKFGTNYAQTITANSLDYVIDTTTARTLSITATWSNALAGNAIQFRQYTCEFLN